MERIYLLATQPGVEIDTSTSPEPNLGQNVKKNKRKATTEPPPVVINKKAIKDATDAVEVWTSQIDDECSIYFCPQQGWCKVLT